MYGTGLAETIAVITTKTLVVALASSACLAAAGAGGYMAVRTNPAVPPAEAAQTAPVPSTGAGRARRRAVHDRRGPA